MQKNIFDEFGSDPILLFGKWMKEAEASEINDPNAMSLATIGADGRPAVRIVLCRGFDANGFRFFTNYESEKGRGLIANPYAELCFHWKSLERQVRVSGPVTKVSAGDSDAYFNSRHRGSRIGAWASSQSRPLESYEHFLQKNQEFEEKFKDTPLPRPPHWGGFNLMPEKIEFWLAHPLRLHRRFVFKRQDGNWNSGWLYP